MAKVDDHICDLCTKGQKYLVQIKSHTQCSKHQSETQTYSEYCSSRITCLKPMFDTFKRAISKFVVTETPCPHCFHGSPLFVIQLFQSNIPGSTPIYTLKLAFDPETDSQTIMQAYAELIKSVQTPQMANLGNFFTLKKKNSRD